MTIITKAGETLLQVALLQTEVKEMIAEHVPLNLDGRQRQTVIDCDSVIHEEGWDMLANDLIRLVARRVFEFSESKVEEILKGVA